MSRVFANCPGDWGSIPGRVIPKNQKMVLDVVLLNSYHYKVRVEWSNPGNGVAPSATPRCSSFIYIYIYIEQLNDERLVS